MSSAAPFSPEFRRALLREIARVERLIDGLDQRIERAKDQPAKNRLSRERYELVQAIRWLRSLGS